MAGPLSLAEYEKLAVRVRAEMQKPPPDRDRDFLAESLPMLRASQDSAAPEPADQAARVAQEPTPAPPRPVGVDPAQDAMDAQNDMAAAAGAGVAQRGREIRDFMMDPMGNDPARTERRQLQAGQENLNIESRQLARGDSIEGNTPESTARAGGGLAVDVGLSAIPGGIVGRGAGAAGLRVAAEATTGGVLMASSVDENQLGMGAIGALGGGAIGVLAELPGMARNFLLRDLVQARKSEASARGQAVEEVSGVRMTVGQKSESPGILAAEASVKGRPGDPRDVFIKQQQADLQESYHRLVGSLNPLQTPPSRIIATTRQAYDSTVRGMQKIAGAKFRTNLEPALKATGAKISPDGRIGNGRGFLDPRELIGELYEQAAAISREVMVKPQVKSAQLRTIHAAIDSLTDAYKKGGLTVEQTQGLMHKLGQASAPSGNTLKDVDNAMDLLDVRRAKDRLEKDLTRTRQMSGPDKWRADAANAMHDARSEYKLDMTEIEGFSGSAVDNLLGKVAGAKISNPDTFARAILKLPAEQFTELMTMVERQSPGTANNIRGLVFEQLVSRNSKTTSWAKLGDHKPRELQSGEMIQELQEMGADKFAALAGVQPVTAARIQAGLQTLQKITKSMDAKGEGRTYRQQFEQYAINLASRDKGFVSRLLAGEMTPGVMEKLLFTKAGQDTLLTFASPRFGRAEIAQAVTFFNQAMQDDDAKREQLRAKLTANNAKRNVPQGPMEGGSQYQ